MTTTMMNELGRRIEELSEYFNKDIENKGKVIKVKEHV